jgi:hypothetical protein
MKNKKLSKVFAAAALAAFSVTTFAQTDLGHECGCPSVGSRTSINLSTFADANGEITSNTNLTCDKLYVIDKKIYVGNGTTLTIQPGTVLKGSSVADPANATGLIIERGGKIMADGKPNCPIVMTSASDPMDGTHSLTNVGEWGGLVLLGTASNNLQDGNVYCANHTTGVGFIEGFDVANPRNLYGAGDVTFPTFNDNDNSGILRYVSVRHAGAILAIGNELNGISFGSVGRGTTVEHVETVAAADDNMEFFGGTVDVKYCSVLWGDDDFYDFDLGYSGRMQFNFGISGDSITGLHTTDNGFECDADDDKKSPTFLRSHPLMYNCTFVSNGHIMPAADNTGPAAIQAKELTEGEFYNNVFVNFRSGLHLAQARSTSTYKGDAYDNWTNDKTDPYLTTASTPGVAKYMSLIVKNNTFIGIANVPGRTGALTKGTMVSGKNPALYKDFTVASAADSAQFLGDGNISVASVPGIDYNWTWNTGHTDFTNPYHFVPSTNLPTKTLPPNDGFFTLVNYRGAFDANKPSWISEGFLVQMKTLQNSNPTDLNNDGVTDISDFSIFINAFGTTDH